METEPDTLKYWDAKRKENENIPISLLKKDQEVLEERMKRRGMRKSQMDADEQARLTESKKRIRYREDIKHPNLALAGTEPPADAKIHREPFLQLRYLRPRRPWNDHHHSHRLRDHAHLIQIGQ